MAEDSMALIELMQKADGGDFLRSLAEAVLQLLMEADVDGLIGASRHERSAERVSCRNGYRDRSLDTRVGSLDLRIPKLRQGSLTDCHLKHAGIYTTLTGVTEMAAINRKTLRIYDQFADIVKWPVYHDALVDGTDADVKSLLDATRNSLSDFIARSSRQRDEAANLMTVALSGLRILRANRQKQVQEARRCSPDLGRRIMGGLLPWWRWAACLVWLCD